MVSATRRTAPPPPASDEQRWFLRPAFVTAVVIPVSGAGAVYLGGSSLFCTGPSRGGANIEHGLVVAATAGSVVGLFFLILLFMLEVGHRNLWSRQLRYLIAAACVLEAAAVAVAIAFVALDSATSLSTGCGFMAPATDDVAHINGCTTRGASR